MDGPKTAAPRVLGRYLLFDEIASGGMATVHLARMRGEVGFARTVAVKRLHAQFAKLSEFVASFVDEARLVGRIHHPNVVSTLDVVAGEGELFLVMEYVHGASLAQVLQKSITTDAPVPPRIAGALICGVLQGLHAAHETSDERGEPLAIIHRDVSPQNVLIGADGVARIVDFGIAKAASRLLDTQDHSLKGKLAYMAPEQIEQKPLSRRADIHAAGVVLWEMLAGRRLFVADTETGLITKIMQHDVLPPSIANAHAPSVLDEVVLQALAAEPEERFATALEMALAVERTLPIATTSEVSAWLEERVGGYLKERRARVASMEAFDASEFDKPSLEEVERHVRETDSDRVSLRPVQAVPAGATMLVRAAPAPQGSKVPMVALVVLALVVAVLLGAWVNARSQANAQPDRPVATPSAGASATQASPAPMTSGHAAAGLSVVASAPPAKSAPATPAGTKPGPKPRKGINLDSRE